MAKVYSIHPLELNPGVTAEEFEKFVNSAGAGLQAGGVKFLKGDRGARKGQYMMLTEWDSVEARNRDFPEADLLGDELLQQMPEATARLYAQLFTLVSEPSYPASYTDYVVIGP